MYVKLEHSAGIQRIGVNSNSPASKIEFGKMTAILKEEIDCITLVHVHFAVLQPVPSNGLA